MESINYIIARLFFKLGSYTSANLKMVVSLYEQIIDRIN